jgi:hypothetical protein
VSATTRRLTTGLQTLAVLLVALYLAAPWLPEQQAWGVWPYTYLPAMWRWLLALLALLIVVATPALRAARAALQRRGKLPRNRAPSRLGAVSSLLARRLGARRWLLYAVVSLASGLLFWMGRIVHTRWGDAYILVNAIPHPEVRLTYNWQAPLDIFLHAKVWMWGNRLFGWPDAMPAYWVLSSLAGVVFVFLLFLLADLVGRSLVEKALTFGLVASLGTMQLFFGYIESYTLICVGILLYLWLAIRALRGEVDLWRPAIVLALTHAFHPSTLVLQPSLWYMGWVLWKQHRLRGPAAVGKVLVPSVVVALGVLALMQSGGHGLEAFLGEDFPGGGDHRWLVPLLSTTTRWEHYTMFSWAHLLDIVNQELLSAPVVLPSLILMAVFAHNRLRGRDREMRFLLLAAGCYLLLTLVWNPDYGGQRDWDLFSPASLPLAVLLAYLLPRALREPEPAPQTHPALIDVTVGLIAVQVIHTAAWVYQNTRPWFWPA